MKKIFALALAAIMALSATATAFAAESTIKQDSQNQSADTAVTFTVGPTYTVTIPTEVQLNETVVNEVTTYENDLSVKAENVRLADNQKVQVTLRSNFALTDTTNPSNPLTYKVSVNGNDVIDQGVVAEFGTSTTQQTSVLHFAAGNPEFSGTYSGTVTFNIAIV